MTKETILIIASIVASPFFAALITGYFSKRKQGAETKNLNISGEIAIGDAWMKYGKEREDEAVKIRSILDSLKEKYEILEEKFNGINKKFDVLRYEKELLEKANTEKDRRIQVLEVKVGELEKELEKYKIVDSKTETAREEIHQSVDESINEIRK